MVQTVELLPDPLIEHAIRQQWQALMAAGLPSPARNTAESNRPHITLAVATVMPEALDAPLEAALAGALPVPLRLGALVVFGGRRRVLARLVVPTAALLDLHAAVAAVTSGLPGPGGRIAPGEWTPHITVARGLTDEGIGHALRRLGKVAEPAGQGVAVRRYDGEGHRERVLRL